jgi:hypothetical protein
MASPMPAPTHDPEPAPRRSRMEDEVLEILYRADRPPTTGEKARARIDEARVAARRSLGAHRFGRSFRAGPLALLIGSLLLAIAAAALRSVAPPLAVLLGLGSAGMLLAIWFDRRPRPSASTRWRGRDLDGPRLPDIERFRERWRNPSDR